MADEQPAKTPGSDEKADEKVDEKRGEKGEKAPEEKWRRDPVGSATWAAILIWIGVALLLGNVDAVAQRAWWETWAVVLAGVGVILLVEVLVRYLRPEYRRPLGGNLVLGIVLLGVGLGQLVDWALVWPAVLIAVGLVFLLRGVFSRR